MKKKSSVQSTHIHDKAKENIKNKDTHTDDKKRVKFRRSIYLSK